MSGVFPAAWRAQGGAGRMQRRVTALLAAVLALGGCSRTDEPASAPTAVEVGGASGGELAESQILHLGNGAEIQTLDPHRGEEVGGANVTRDLYEGLVSEAPNGDLTPGARSERAPRPCREPPVRPSGPCPEATRPDPAGAWGHRRATPGVLSTGGTPRPSVGMCARHPGAARGGPR